MLTTYLVAALKMRSFVLGNRVMCDGLLSPRSIFDQVVAATFLLDVDKASETIVLENFVALL